MAYNPVVTTGVQGVSRAISAAPAEDRAATTRRALATQAGAVVPLALAFFFAAPSITRAMNAPHLTLAMRIATGVLFFYGLYTPLVGVLNGERRFIAQAAIDALFATLRTVALLLGAWWFKASGAGVEGALGAFVAAAGLVLFIALPLAGTGKRGRGGVSVRAHLAFLAPLFFGQVALNLLLQSDLQLLGRFAADAAEAAGHDARDADKLTGAYRAAQLFCFLPYQLLLSVTFVLFPLLASAARDGDRAAVGRYVTTGVRLALVFGGLVVSVNAAIPAKLLALVFRLEFADLGARAMFVLAIGLGAFALFGILASVLTSLGRERQSAALTVAALALVVALSFAFVRGEPFGEGMVLRTALATSASLVIATVCAAVAVHRAAGQVVRLRTLVRVALALAVAIATGRAADAFFGASPALAVPLAALVGLAYVGTLIATRELAEGDIASLRRVLKRGDSSA
ncbi:MAG: lipopolysaccharide biosynthesis protein [Myxococcales bacterium]|nr:lipopolysaccharide biosynthesis protein [Myxococcales bacterium]